MSLVPGSRVGPYEVIGSLGAGGMGEVYRARDPRLKRDVALKVLPDAVASDPERLARFEREAQALAALKHPHIASIHGIEESSGVRALVLELVEGETLAGRLERGPVPVADAMAISRQIVDALEAAHEQGIVHRDLKPANIQIAPDGSVKVLDFGLARIVEPHDGIHASATRLDSMSPTITSPALVTGHNVLMGTAAYMAPEQARGKPADKRADIWSFGVVLYEMLTGTRAFVGETVTEVAGAVIHKEIDLGAVPGATPDSVRMVLRRCLQKDPRQRLRDMGDVRLLLDGAFDAPTSRVPQKNAGSRWRMGTIASAAALVGAMLAAAAVWTGTRRDPIPRYPIRVDVAAPSEGTIALIALALSPDGRHLAYVAPGEGGQKSGAENRLWVHSFEDGRSRVVTPDDIAFTPIWSPDSRFLAFLSDGKLKRVAIDGSGVQLIADLMTWSGACWVSDDVIVIGTDTGLVRIPASGGIPTQVTQVNRDRGETTHAVGASLRDGRHFFYFRGSSDPNNNGIYLGRIDAAPNDQVLTRLSGITSSVSYATDQNGGNGRVLFLRDGILMSQSFDPRRLELVGEPARVPGVEPVQVWQTSVAAISASANGAMAYRRAQSQLASPVFVSRDGKELGAIAPGLNRAEHPRISPDGRSLALIVDRNLWRYDLAGRPPVKLTFDGALSPVWSSDGRRIAYEGGGTLRAVLSDGSGKPENIAPPGHYHAHSFTPDSREIVALQLAPVGDTGSLVRLTLEPGAAAQPIVAGGISAALSPDGRWLAYAADTTGAQEIWVRPYPGPGASIRVSPGGGTEPVWAKNGRELYYLQDKLVMAVAVDTSAGFNFKPAVRLFETSYLQNAQPPSYDVTADGRFVMLKSQTGAPETITVVFNWVEMLRSGSLNHR